MTSPFKVAAPVVDRVEKLPGDCAFAGVRSQGARDQDGSQADGRYKEIGEPHSCLLLIPGRSPVIHEDQ
jgi:hypothetical protein